ncbi:hypothetical protein T459_34627 [Capsicum annuum]|uniref:Uncharacterized protein n=1 Tax=Capsicum annuum TaxID=4072 RepID=A0A2G2XVR5_CAPAN|nr:hypothetical protein T459_34627 [Capsicum annuum]
MQFGTITRFLIHPALPVLLTKNGPLGALDSVARLDKAVASPAPKSDERLACQYRCGPPPEFPLAFPQSGIVHYLSCPNRYAHTRTLLRRSRPVGGAPLVGIPPISFLIAYGFTRPLTRTHVRLLGLFFKMGQMGIPQARFYSARMSKHARGTRFLPQSRIQCFTIVSRARALAAPPIHVVLRSESISELARPHSISDRGALPAPILFPPNNFKHSLTLFKFLFIFPLRYLFAIDLSPRVIPPDLGSQSKCLIAKDSQSPDARRDIAATTKIVEIQPPLAITSINMDSHLGQLRARGAWEESIRPTTTASPIIKA